MKLENLRISGFYFFHFCCYCCSGTSQKKPHKHNAMNFCLFVFSPSCWWQWFFSAFIFVNRFFWHFFPFITSMVFCFRSPTSKAKQIKIFWFGFVFPFFHIVFLMRFNNLFFLSIKNKNFCFIVVVVVIFAHHSFFCCCCTIVD